MKSLENHENFCLLKDFQTCCLCWLKLPSCFLLANFPQLLGWLQVVGTHETYNVFFPTESHEARCLLKFSAMTSRTQSMQVAMELV